MIRYAFYFILITFSLSFISVLAESHSSDVHPQVQKILNQADVPEGVVFDIETLDSDALNSLAPYVTEQIELIRKRYPGVDIAVVTHGAEEFALQKQAQSQNSDLHAMFSRLVTDQSVSVHVCGAVGGLKNLTREDFPEFISYSDSGMAQLNDYKALGYQVVVINQLSEKERKALFDTPKEFIK